MSSQIPITHNLPNFPDEITRHVADPSSPTNIKLEEPINITSLGSFTNLSATNVNPQLLYEMMDCVDTTIFSPPQLTKWEDMKNVACQASDYKFIKNEYKSSPYTSDLYLGMQNSENKNTQSSFVEATNNSTSYETNEDKSTTLHRGASVQDILLAMLDLPTQTSTTSVKGDTNGTSGTIPRKNTLMSLLGSDNFTELEKKESLRHLFGFIDNAYESSTEPMKDIYKDTSAFSEQAHLQRQTSLQMMKMFLSPDGTTSANENQMNRTKSYEAIQAMLLASANQDIQKPMSSIDSFRFMQLANSLATIEDDVAGDEDYGDAVQVDDNLDNLMDYNGPSTRQTGNSQSFADMSQAQTYQPQQQYYQYNNGYMQGNPNASVDMSQYGMPTGTQMINNSFTTTQVPQSYAGLNNMMNSSNHHAYAMDNTLGSYNPSLLSQNYMMDSLDERNNSSAETQEICSALGCNNLARTKGMCKIHGGGRRCKIDGCMKSAQTGQLCIAHGGGKPCTVEGCTKTAQSRGRCKQHGGGVRCKFEGCEKSCQSQGYCRGHGGGKRCDFPDCTKWAQKNGYCAKHAKATTQLGITGA